MDGWSRMAPSIIVCSFRKLARGCGLDNVRFHDLRHTHATLLLDDGTPMHVVQSRLDHQSIQTAVEIYRHVLAMEVLRGMREAASRGFWVAPMAPYGYRKVKVQDGPKERPTLEPDPETTGIVKRIFDLAESRKGMMKIVRILNDEGIASPRGKLWNKPTVHNILRNEAYLGTLVWGNNAKDGADPVLPRA